MNLSIIIHCVKHDTHDINKHDHFCPCRSASEKMPPWSVACARMGCSSYEHRRFLRVISQKRARKATPQGLGLAPFKMLKPGFPTTRIVLQANSSSRVPQSQWHQTRQRRKYRDGYTKASTARRRPDDYSRAVEDLRLRHLYSTYRF